MNIEEIVKPLADWLNQIHIDALHNSISLFNNVGQVSLTAIGIVGIVIFLRSSGYNLLGYMFAKKGLSLWHKILVLWRSRKAGNTAVRQFVELAVLRSAGRAIKHRATAPERVYGINAEHCRAVTA